MLSALSRSALRIRPALYNTFLIHPSSSLPPNTTQYILPQISFYPWFEQCTLDTKTSVIHARHDYFWYYYIILILCKSDATIYPRTILCKVNSQKLCSSYFLDTPKELVNKFSEFYKSILEVYHTFNTLYYMFLEFFFFKKEVKFFMNFFCWLLWLKWSENFLEKITEVNERKLIATLKIGISYIFWWSAHVSERFRAIFSTIIF